MQRTGLTPGLILWSLPGMPKNALAEIFLFHVFIGDHMGRSVFSAGNGGRRLRAGADKALRRSRDVPGCVHREIWTNIQI